MAVSIAAHHAEWLSLVEVSGPFLAMRALGRVFPQGLDETPPGVRQRLQVAHEEWLDNQEGLRPDAAIHRAFVRFVLREALGFEERDLVEGQALPPSLSVAVAEHREVLRPTYAVLEPADREGAGTARLLVEVVPPGQGLDQAVAGRSWKASPATRMMALLHGASGPRLGLVTNGHVWMLVHAAPGETTTWASFQSHLFFEEPLTLRAFASLLALRRFFGVAEGESLEALFAESAQDQQEVTDQLGLQVRRAVEVLVQAVDRINRGRGGRLLAGVGEVSLYQAAVTVMMRLVFLLAAEQRDLLLLGTELYDQHYAVTTLWDQLEEVATKQGDEVLERRYDAWCRLLATFRAVHGGVRHEDLLLPAYGGSLFDPDRFPFLEGRAAGSSWRDAGTAALAPMAVDDRTVLQLLRSMQLLEVRVGGGRSEARRLSFRAIDVEQIGHVYEGLLDHTAKRAIGTVLSLDGRNEPEIAVAELEAKRAEGDKALVEWLAGETGRSEKAISKGLVEYKIPKDDARRLLAVCENKGPVYGRIEPWAGLVRRDPAGNPVLIHDGGIYVTEGAERRATGTHYTPRSLTEPIVQHTLDPLVYEGPAEGWAREAWKLRTPREILALRVCDMAMGSGAFLVQACRYLSERLVEAWEAAEKAAGGKLVITPEGELSRGEIAERALAIEAEERLTLGRRYVADRCLYGVDKNPMAVEMAKLSLWLVTLQKDRPFTFLDHALRSGDSLLGLTQRGQLEKFHIAPDTATQTLLGENIFGAAFRAALDKRREITSISELTIEDSDRKARLLAEAEGELRAAHVVADLVVGAALANAGKRQSALDDELKALGIQVSAAFDTQTPGQERDQLLDELRKKAQALLDEGRGLKHPERRPFHWVLEFPEVFGVGGFDAFVGNPPFQYGTLAATALSEIYMRCLQLWSPPWHGKADLVVGFLKRATALAAPDANVGLVATSGMIHGESLESGLRPALSAGWSISAATSPRVWPGGANVDYVITVLSRNWRGACLLDNQHVEAIGEDLSPASLESADQPHELMAGVEAYMGVKLSPANRQIGPEALESIPLSLRATLLPTIGGEELYGLVDPATESWRTFEPGLLRALAASDLEEGLREAGISRVEDIDHSRPASALQVRLLERRLAFACGETSVHLAFRLVPNSGVTLKHKCIVFPTNSWSTFAVLQSSLHDAWAWRWGLRRQVRLTYSAKRCAQTFAPPSCDPISLSVSGKALHDAREHVLRQCQEGLTAMYNRFHNPAETSPDIQTLRDLHVEMDLAVAAAYGWTDLRLDHGFHDTKQGLRYTVSEPARREILDRLLELNHARYAAEVAAGLHDKDAKKKARAAAAPTTATPAALPPAARQLDLLGWKSPPPPTTPSPSPAPPLPDAAPAILEALRTAYAPLSKAEVLAKTGLAEAAWKAAIDRLKADGRVEQVGERRGTKYRLARPAT